MRQTGCQYGAVQ